MREFTSAALQDDAAAAVPMEPIEFKLDDETFTTLTEITGDAMLEWSELGLAAVENLDAESPEGAAYLARFLRAGLGLAEYQRFRLHVRARKTPPGTVLEIVAHIQEAMAAAVTEATGRPTVPSSPSSPGPEGQGGQRARVISLAQGTVQFADPPPRAAPQDRRRKGGGTRKRPAAPPGSG